MSNGQMRQRIAAEVRAEIARQGRRQVEVVAIINRDKANVSRRMLGHVPFLGEELANIAAWLGVPVSQFLPDNVTDVAA